MKVIVIGGTGHIGRFLTPMLADAGLETVVVTRGVTRLPEAESWRKVRLHTADSSTAAVLRPLLLAERPDAVVDIPGTAQAVHGACHGTAIHLVAVGSVWMFGEPRVVPTPEETQGPCPFAGYAQRYAELQEMLRNSGRAGGVTVTAIMPPNICGPGKIPLDCLGGRDIELHRGYSRGAEVVLPDGADALVGPCDAEDIAQCIRCAVLRREQAAGQLFNVGSASALTWPEIVAAYAEIYGTSLPIRRIGWREYVDTVSPDIGCWWHMKAHMCPDIAKARRLLGYEPRFTPRATLARAVEWMRTEKILATV
jgi:nucleoside-diphosphate-sugar epimerase